MAAKLRVVSDPEGEFLAAVEQMPEGYLECRGSQHRFNLIEPFRIVDSGREQGYRSHGGHQVYAVRVLECDRCIDPETGHGMIRHDYYEITSHRGHTFLRKINASYLPPAGYATSGLGRIAGNRGLVLGAALDRTMNGTPVRGRGRPRRSEA
jgi:hypothetical protein